MQRGIHKGLTTAKILDESFALVDGGGPAALTMRALARRLDVAAMAIYNHFQDRDAILDALAERVFAELAHEPAIQIRSRQKWRDRLLSMVMGAHQLAAHHPHIYRLAMSRPDKPGSALQLTEEAIGTLREAGLSEKQATSVYHTFLILLHGFPFWRESFERHLSECVPGKAGAPEEVAEQQFTAAVELLLNSVEALAAKRTGPKQAKKR